MAKRAEISFEEATSVAPVGQSGAGEISFDEAIGQEISPSQALSLPKLNLNWSSDPAEITRRYGFQPSELDAKPDDTFAAQTGKTVMRSIIAAQTRPKETGIGAIKALTSGAISLGESAVAGVRGLIEGPVRRAASSLDVIRPGPGLPMSGRGTPRGQSLLNETVSTINRSMEDTAKLRQAAGQITKINLAPEGEQEQAMHDLLMLIPEGITAGGDTVYEKFGALAGASTQGLLTLLTFKPGIVGKIVGKEPSPQIARSVEALGKEDLAAAEAVIAHVAQTQPVAAKKLKVRLKTGQANRSGRAAARREMPVGEITPEDAGVGLAEAAADVQRAAESPPVEPTAAKPTVAKFIADEETGAHKVTSPVGEILTQENLGYLQIKRADVIASERGQGHAQAMMQQLLEQAEKRDLRLASDFSVSPAAQRVYDALQRKGYRVNENPNTVNPETGSKVSNDPRVPVYEVSAPADAGRVAAQAEQIFVSGTTLDSIPGGQFAKGKLTAWFNEIIRTINPEGLGLKAKQAAAVLANKIAEAMNKDSANHGFAKERIDFWEKLPPSVLRNFMLEFEKGAKHSDPVLQKVSDYMRERNKEIYAQDQAAGIKYDPIDNYLYHVFEDGEKLANHFQAKYGVKWGDPSFTKDRVFDFYEEAITAGFKPKFTNPEALMLARQHASDVALMKVELLKDLESYGIAKKITKADKDPPKGAQYNYRRSPTGDGYWVDAHADAILHNAFDTASMWSMPGIRGDVFRGAMFLKNASVPIVLAASLFHPLHLLLGMDSAATMTRLTKEMIAGNLGPVKWFGKWMESLILGSGGIPLKGIIDSPKVGSRLLRAYQGKIKPSELTAADTVALQYMAEGGMIPEMSVQFRTNAMENFRKSVRQTAAEYNGRAPLQDIATSGMKAGFWLPFAIIDAIQAPMFRWWIPSLKIASYLKDVQTALKTDPMLASDKGRRLLAFRKLAKSVDNRYGEMAYNTLFWNRTIKDIAVANTLSLGWNLGFIREYGGGAMDIGQAATRKGSLAEKARRGDLDRPLFVSFYTSQVMLYAGLLHWALSGEQPATIQDYLYPKSGNQNAKGEDERLNTMFYPREFAAIAKHIEHEGVAPGMWHVISNKSSGVVGMVKQWATGVNWMGQEVRDPNSPWHQQIRDTLGATLMDLEPISVKSLRESERSPKDVVLSISGFNRAPKYATQSKTEAAVLTLYRKYYTQKQTPYESALLSNDRRKLAQHHEKGDYEAYDELLDKMMEKYDLTVSEQQRLTINIMRRGVDYNPTLTMFERLTWQQQKRLLDKMSPDEREQYLPHSNREHLRFSYEEPEEETN